jgi:FkbM family methyltransferase
MLANPDYVNHDSGLEALYVSLILNDEYGLRELALDGAKPDVFYDIGANVGLVSVMARMLFPTVRIVAVEPFPETFFLLKANTAHLHIDCRQVALGDGEPLGMWRSPGVDLCNQTRALATDDPADIVPIASVRLSELVGKQDREGFYIIKIDVEGAEKFLLDDPNAGAVLRGACHWVMEYHEKLVGMSPTQFVQRLGVDATIRHIPSSECYILRGAP